MRGGIILCAALFIASVTASPLALERPKDDKPLSVVDVPAGVFENQESEKTEVNLDSPTEVKPITDVSKDVEIVDPVVSNKNKDEESEQEGPSVFGIRFPSILIIRRPVFQDPFAGFQSPFFSSFNRRPLFGGSSVDSVEKVDKEPLSGQDTQIDEQKKNQTVSANTDLVQRMHQQINNLFANLFNPDAFAMPRPTFPRPIFSRPFFPPAAEDSDEFDDKLDFDKLPANYSNSTSETKMVDGHLVTVNKTVHKISGNNSNGFFHFSVIKVGPSATQLESAAETTKPTIPEVVESESRKETVTTENKPEKELDPKLNEVDRADDADQVSEHKPPKNGVDTGLLL